MTTTDRTDTQAQPTVGWWTAQGSRRRALFTLGSVINASLVVALLIHGPSSKNKVIIALLLLICAYLQIRLLGNSSERPLSRNGTNRDNTDHGTGGVIIRIANLLASVSDIKRERYLDRGMLVTSHLFLYPSITRKRVKEHITIASGTLTKNVAIEISLDSVPDTTLKTSDSANLLIVPVMRPVKGRLITGLQISDSNGSAISTLSYEEGLTYSAGIAIELFQEAFGLTKKAPNEWSKSQGEVFATILETLVMIPRFSEYAAPALRTVRDRVGDAFAKQCEVTPDLTISNTAQYDRLLEFVKISSTNYSILAEVNVANRLNFKYSYQVALDTTTLNRPKQLVSQVKGQLRDLFGGLPTNIRIAAGKAKRCGSYHLTLTTPANSHIAGMYLTEEDGSLVHRQRLGDYTLGGAYFRVAGRGLDEAHFYGRNLSRLEKALVLEIRLYETPPGAIGRALIVSMLLSFLIAVAGTVVPRDASSFNVDVAAVVLAAVPAALAARSFILGNGSQRSKVHSLMASISGASSIVLLLFAAAALIWSQDDSYAKSPVHQIDLTTVGSSDSVWSLLFLASSLNALTIAATLIIRRRRHRRLLEKNFNVDDEWVKVA